MAYNSSEHHSNCDCVYCKYPYMQTAIREDTMGLQILNGVLTSLREMGGEDTEDGQRMAHWASGAMYSCPRKAWLEYHGVQATDTDVNESILSMGEHVEDDVVLKYMKAGQYIRQQEHITIWDPRLRLPITGKIDLLIHEGADIIPVEIKSRKDSQEKEGYDLWKSRLPQVEHVAQLTLYLKAKHKTKGYLHYVNKNRSIDARFEVTYREEFYDEVVRRLKDLEDSLLGPEPDVPKGFRKDKFPCFPAGTMVRTAHGMVPIETIKKGEMVLSHDGLFHRVLETSIRQYSGELVRTRIGSLGNMSPIATPDHPFYTGEGWAEARNLLGIDIPRIVPNLRISSTPLSPDTAWLLGLFCAEGDVAAKGHSVRFNLGAHEDYLKERLLSSAYKGFDGLRHPTVYVGNGSCRVAFNSTKLANFVSDCGAGAENKRIPMVVKTADFFAKAAFLEGLIEGDGYTSIHRNEVRLSSVSSTLIQETFELITTLGGRANVRLARPAGTAVIEGRNVVTKPAYEVYSASPSVLSLLRGWRRGDKISYHENARRVFGVEFVRVQDMPVYNMSVEDSQSYVLFGGVAVHNCSWYSVDWGKTDAVGTCKFYSHCHREQPITLSVEKIRWWQ